MTVSPFYDPLVAKVIAKGATRISTIRRLREGIATFSDDRSLEGTSTGKFIVQGPPNNIEFLQTVLSSDIFVTGAATTEWVDSGGVNFKPRLDFLYKISAGLLIKRTVHSR